MATRRFPVAAHRKRLEHQWEQIEAHRQDLLHRYPISDGEGLGGAPYRRWLELGEIQQHIDAACIRLERLTRLS
jgi:hypothetical protein